MSSPAQGIGVFECHSHYGPDGSVDHVTIERADPVIRISGCVLRGEVVTRPEFQRNVDEETITITAKNVTVTYRIVCYDSGRDEAIAELIT